jgi:hypothetical protein
MALSSARKAGFLLASSAAFLLAGAALAADAVNPPIIDWTPPARWSSHSASRGLTTQGDISFGALLVAVTPCRQYDSRNTTPLLDNTPRTITITGAPCGIPSGAAAAAVNITVFNIAGQGGNAVFKLGTTSPPTTAWINYPPGQGQIGNAGVVALNNSGQIVVQVNQGGGSIDFTVDVYGYFLDSSGTYNTNEFIGIDGNTGTSWCALLFVENHSTNTVANCIAGIRGINAGSTAGIGVRGSSFPGTGVNFGVVGETASTSSGAAGVTGTTAGGLTNVFGGALGVFGNDGTASGIGVLATSQNRGLDGARVNSLGALQTSGVVGYSGTSGVHSFNDITAGGTKFFIVPHPDDASKQIGYASLEGNEAGTYFRGRGRFVGGHAVIRVPEDFQMVTEDDGLTVQITPLGRMAQVGVISMDLYHIVAESSRDVEFSYLVQGVRRGYADLKPIQENVYFVPSSADARMDSWPQSTKDTLIRLGIYNADGTVNMETAERLGWAKVWAENAKRDAVRAEAYRVFLETNTK